MLKKITILSIILIMLITTSICIYGEQEVSLYDSMFLLVFQDKNENDLGYGNCFVTKCEQDNSYWKTKFVTAEHVLSAFTIPTVKKMVLRNKNKTIPFKLSLVASVKRIKNKDYGHFVLYLHEKITPLKVVKESSFEIDQKVKMRSILYYGDRYYFSHGEILDITKHNSVFTNIFARGGCSGSPIFDDNDNVIGITSSVEYYGVTFNNAQWRPMYFVKIR